MKKSTTTLLAVNVVGLAIFLYVFHGTLMEQRDSRDLGSGMVFLFYSAPVFLLCLAVDVAWGIMAVVALVKRREFQDVVACGAMAAVWVLAYGWVKQHSASTVPPRTAMVHAVCWVNGTPA